MDVEAHQRETYVKPQPSLRVFVIFPLNAFQSCHRELVLLQPCFEFVGESGPIDLLQSFSGFTSQPLLHSLQGSGMHTNTFPGTL